MFVLLFIILISFCFLSFTLFCDAPHQRYLLSSPALLFSSDILSSSSSSSSSSSLSFTLLLFPSLPSSPLCYSSLSFPSLLFSLPFASFPSFSFLLFSFSSAFGQRFRSAHTLFKYQTESLLTHWDVGCSEYFISKAVSLLQT